MKKILENKTLIELINLYEYEIKEIKENYIVLYDKQLDEEVKFDKKGLIEYFAIDCKNRYYIDNNIFHLKQYKELKNLLTK